MSSNGSKRLKEVLALWMVGEGLIGALRPRRYMQLWRFGPERYQKFIETLTDHPNTTRLLCAAEATIGVWWALRQLSNSSELQLESNEPRRAIRVPLAAKPLLRLGLF
jgi:hypothetical protein